ncbi:MAG: hypothetical protein RLZZ148_2190 [Cyanobacteriota bacterium]
MLLFSLKNSLIIYFWKIPLLVNQKLSFFVNSVRNQDVTEVITTEHGTKYVIIGTINTPKNKSVTILTVWIIGRI